MILVVRAPMSLCDADALAAAAPVTIAKATYAVSVAPSLVWLTVAK